MYAGLGDFWADVGNALGPAAEAAGVVAARINRARQSGQNLSVAAALAQAVAAGDIDSATARRIADLAGQVAGGAGQVQTAAEAAGNLSDMGRLVRGLPGWALPVGAAAVLWLVLRR